MAHKDLLVILLPVQLVILPNVVGYTFLKEIFLLQNTHNLGLILSTVF